MASEMAVAGADEGGGESRAGCGGHVDEAAGRAVQRDGAAVAYVDSFTAQVRQRPARVVDLVVLVDAHARVRQLQRVGGHGTSLAKIAALGQRGGHVYARAYPVVPALRMGANGSNLVRFGPAKDGRVNDHAHAFRA